jgi:hypothetical protein
MEDVHVHSAQAAPRSSQTSSTSSDASGITSGSDVEQSDEESEDASQGNADQPQSNDDADDTAGSSDHEDSGDSEVPSPDKNPVRLTSREPSTSQSPPSPAIASQRGSARQETHPPCGDNSDQPSDQDEPTARLQVKLASRKQTPATSQPPLTNASRSSRPARSHREMQEPEIIIPPEEPRRNPPRQTKRRTGDDAMALGESEANASDSSEAPEKKRTHAPAATPAPVKRTLVGTLTSNITLHPAFTLEPPEPVSHQLPCGYEYY